MKQLKTKTIGIYIHIPFCTRRCGYCDFLTFAGANAHYEPYTQALIKEIETHPSLHKYTITSIFIGGGTPTTLSEDSISGIFTALKKYKIAPDAEITIEANPGTLSLKMLRALKNAGVNRLSMGLQTWHNKGLKKIQRGHSVQDFLRNYKHARKLGFNNINVDLIFSLPVNNGNEQENFIEFYETLKNVTALNPEHLSVYSLIIEEGTRFYEQEENGTLIPQSVEMDRRMYHFTQKYLEKKGYTQYEISNFSKRGKVCNHNILYWRRGEYVGFGLGASGFIDGKRESSVRDLQEYINILKGEDCARDRIIEDITEISKEDAMAEFMYLGLRCLDGISKSEFKDNFGVSLYDVFGEQLSSHSALLEDVGDNIRLTKKGLDISNQIFADFL